MFDNELENSATNTCETCDSDDSPSPQKSISLTKSLYPSLDDIEINFDYIESAQNYQGNYNNYVYYGLKSLIPLRSVKYTEIIEGKKLLIGDGNVNSVNSVNSANSENSENSENSSQKKTIILDLDETLIHADFDNNYKDHDTNVSFKFNDEEVLVPIFIRPGLIEFLEKISKQFEIFVFTASVKEYADSVLNHIDPDNKFFTQRFYRDNCICVKNKVYIKDLRIFSDRKLENLIIVDNSIYSFTNQISNGVLINSFYNDKNDKELGNVAKYLEGHLLNSSDVRNVNDQVFNFSSILGQLST